MNQHGFLILFISPRKGVVFLQHAGRSEVRKNIGAGMGTDHFSFPISWPERAHSWASCQCSKETNTGRFTNPVFYTDQCQKQENQEPRYWIAAFCVQSSVQILLCLWAIAKMQLFFFFSLAWLVMVYSCKIDLKLTGGQKVIFGWGREKWHVGRQPSASWLPTHCFQAEKGNMHFAKTVFILCIKDSRKSQQSKLCQNRYVLSAPSY